MGTAIGVWIDSRTAVIVAVEPGAEPGAAATSRVSHVTTFLEKQLRLSGGQRAKTDYGTQTAPADDLRETSSKANLQYFFDDVVAAVRSAPSIFLFGPGEAKDEFKKRLVREGLGRRIDGVETVGRMTERQIAAKVRAHFRVGV
jgi:hypothetical protein